MNLDMELFINPFIDPYVENPTAAGISQTPLKVRMIFN